MLLVMLSGGPSQLDTIDPKPNALSEVRGEFKTISTAIPGVMDRTATNPTSRRKFLAASSVTAAGALLSPKRLGAQAYKNSKLRILQIGTGGIGELDRSKIKTHPMAEFVGFCDIDKNILSAISKEFPNAFTLVDYRDAFADPWSPIPKPGEVPEHIRWDLWNGPLMEPSGTTKQFNPAGGVPTGILTVVNSVIGDAT